MTSAILVNQINKRLEQINMSDKSIVILKGIPLDLVGEEYIPFNVEDIVKNKLGYFMGIFNKRKYLSYEEFLLLNSFILEQYEKIYILNNNIYINQYPIDINMCSETRNGLITHFGESEDDNDDSEIGKIDEIIDLYNGIKEYHGFLIGSYCEDKIPESIKISNINLFEYENCSLQTIKFSDELNYLEISDESDYIELVKKVFNEPEEIYIRTSNFTGDIDRLNSHIAILANNWSEFTDIYVLQVQEISQSYESRCDYKDILKKYWKYDEFREFDVYDINKLEAGEKCVVKVSQEQIISDLVEQVENCIAGDKAYRDVFVTAPTGAGKSVIFQVPAIYLAQKYNLLTIVVSPLIGLMNDQVDSLERKNYKGAKTINSDISPILKEEVLNDVADGNTNILYLSPETLLARSSVEQLIGDRTIGLIIIDEAHIVTTWGKQFRPDYWYLGEHIRKIRDRQMKNQNKGQSFVIGTFTATAIYHGVEDMYEETKESLQMIDPITYLGYVRRNDINIVIDTSQKPKGQRREYETDKFEDILNIVKRAKLTNKKTLVYFPTVSLIEGCYQYLENKKMVDSVTKYYGPLPKEYKDENYRMFLDGSKLVMLATKAFGMGIDINNIEIVAHYAPTGNVCDYVQEIGRAARRYDLNGEAYYHYNSRDFKYINRLHGLSTIKKYQLIEVVKKIVELYKINLSNHEAGSYTKKRNAMLVDAENFTYIFDSPISEGDENLNKVKTALLIIQKDYEAKIGFSPIVVRPIPLFSFGFFSIDPMTQKRLIKSFGNCLNEINSEKHICRVNLETIWSKDKECQDKSFPQFKFLLYTGDAELKFNQSYLLKPALCVSVEFENDFLSIFNNIWSAVKKLANDGVISQEYISYNTFVDELEKKSGLNKYRARAICDVLFASMGIYRRNYSKSTNSIYQVKELNSGEVKYQFKTAINSYFKWVENGLFKIQNETQEGEMYIINSSSNTAREINTLLGILETFGVLKFEMSGGAGSQLYIYINQVRNLEAIINHPGKYDNRLLDTVAERHLISVQMLTYIYEGGFSNDEIWDIIEDYFLGKIPAKVKSNCLKIDPNLSFNKNSMG